MSGSVTTDGVRQLLVERLADVLGLSAEQVEPTSRFDEDLHADSLDLVEVVEGVERALAGRGVTVSIPDEELAGFTTVGQAAERIAVLAHPVDD